MPKGKNPRKRREPPSEPQISETEVARPTEEARPLPAPRREQAIVSERGGQALFHLVQALRLAAGAVLDLADAAAEAIQRTFESREPRGNS